MQSLWEGDEWGVTRIKRHLGGITGEVIACDKVSPDVRIFFKNMVEAGKEKAVKKDKVDHEVVRSGPSDEGYNKEMEISLRHSRLAAIEKEQNREMRSGPSNSSRSSGGLMRRSLTTTEQAPIDLREENIRKKEEDISAAKRLNKEEEARRQKMQRTIASYEAKKKEEKNLIAKFFRSLGRFYGNIGIKYKSSHKKSLKDLVKTIREQDEDPSPPSNSEEVNVYIDDEDDSDDGSDWDEGYNS